MTSQFLAELAKCTHVDHITRIRIVHQSQLASLERFHPPSNDRVKKALEAAMAVAQGG